ncbi:amidohydrolase family protein [Oceaniglobus ichthyenteri]|uniref:amidohydrolase family protein n=1 Tax=Oceaniglobus ichthyenteri TaxID=2136177 RepID=UPI000D34F82D|nr:amidohydrolase family protein [Oceaniglobus ichthyenteri]
MFDLILRNATLKDGSNTDIGIADGKITALEQNVGGDSHEVVECAGQLVTPPFVDAHFHMDATLSLGMPRMNVSGTLLEGIALWGELKPQLTVEGMVERALRYCDLAVSRGLLAIRSHVDVSDPTLRTAEAMLEVQRLVKPYIDLQLVAFPQDGYLRSPGAVDLLNRSLDMGLNIVGGIPHFERTMADGAASVEQLCRIAADRGLPVDLHCDESDDPMSRHIETLAQQTVRFGLQGRVTGSHLTSMHSMDNYYATKLIALMVEADIRVIANPLINITLQGRHDSYPKRRGQTRVPELMAAGLTVAFGHDCVMDPWYSLGSGDMLEVASMGLHVAQMTSRAAIGQAFDAVTANPAKILGLPDYGIALGNPADLVLLQATSAIEAVRLRPTRLAVIKGGRIIARTAPQITQLSLTGRPDHVNPADYAPKT